MDSYPDERDGFLDDPSGDHPEIMDVSEAGGDRTLDAAMGRIARRSERRILTPEERARLFYREIALSELPLRAAEIPEDTEIIPARLVGGASFEVNGNVVHVRSHHLFIWNALLYLRDQKGGIARNDVFKLGFSGHATELREANWEEAIGPLVQKVNEAAGTDIIQVEGERRGRRYHIHPGLSLEKGEEYEERQRGFYEFAQTISGPLLRTSGITVHVNDETPLLMLIRDNETVVINNAGSHLNQHDRSLLHIITLANGQPLTPEQIFALGFHAYGVGKQSRRVALHRSMKRLNAMDERPLLHLRKTEHGTSVHTLRSFSFKDLREANTDIRTISAARRVFNRLMAHAPENAVDVGMHAIPREQLVEWCTTYADSLTLIEAYSLSLRLGVRFAFLEGTSYKSRQGSIVKYDEVAEHIIPGTPLPRPFIGQLLSSSDGPVNHAETNAIRKLEEQGHAPTLERDGGPLGELIAEVEALDPKERAASYVLGDLIQELMALLGASPAETEAATLYLTPTINRTSSTITLSGFSLIRRYFRSVSAWLDEDEQLQRFPKPQQHYRTAAFYFGQLLGDPAERVPVKSFNQMTEGNAYFDEHGARLCADICSLLIVCKENNITFDADR